MCWPARRSNLLPDRACQQFSLGRKAGPAVRSGLRLCGENLRFFGCKAKMREQLNFARQCSK